MTKDGGNSVSTESGSDSGEGLSFEIMDRFVDRLVEEIAKPGAVISADYVKTLAADFKSKNAKDYLARFRDYFDKCLSEHEEEIWDQTRKRPFDRMVVKRFSNLFPAEGGLILTVTLFHGVFFRAFSYPSNKWPDQNCSNNVRHPARR